MSETIIGASIVCAFAAGVVVLVAVYLAALVMVTDLMWRKSDVAFRRAFFHYYRYPPRIIDGQDDPAQQEERTNG